MPTQKAGRPAGQSSPGSVDDGVLEALPPSQELLAFYRDRIKAFSQEREELLARVDAAAASRHDVHENVWKLRQASDELERLRTSLSDAHVALYEERQRAMALAAEVDNLRQQEAANRRRIQHMMQLITTAGATLGGGVEDQSRGRQGPARAAAPDAGGAAPPQLPHVSLAALASGRAAAQLAGRGAAGGGSPERPYASGAAGGSLFLPVHDVEALVARVESLEAQMAAERAFANDRVAALLDDRRIREADFSRARAEAAERAEALQARLARSEELLTKATREYVVAKAEAAEAAAQAAEAKEQAAAERRALREERAAVQAQGASQSSRFRTIREAESHAEALTARLQEREEEALRSGAIALQYERRCGELQQELSRARAAAADAEKRRQRDLEGFTADFTLLRKQLAAAERRAHSARLAERLRDDDRLESMLEALEKRAPSPPPPEGAAGGRARKGAARSPQDVGAGLLEVKRNLAKAGDRLARVASANAGASPPGRENRRPTSAPRPAPR